MIVARPCRGFRPATMLRPPATSIAPVAWHRLLRSRNPLGPGVARHAFGVLEMIDAVVDEKPAEDCPSDKVQRAHSTPPHRLMQA